MPFSWGEGEAAGDALRDLQRLLGRQWSFGFFEQALDVPAAHQLSDDERLALMPAEVEDGDDVGLRAQSAHRLSLARDPLTPSVIEALGSYERERHVAVE